jgi:hypothetical protein
VDQHPRARILRVGRLIENQLDVVIGDSNCVLGATCN